MNFGHYSDAPVALAVDLVNHYATEPRRADGTAAKPPPPLDAFLAAHGLPADGVGEGDLEAVAQLADRLFTVFAAADDEEAVRVLNELLAETDARPRISGHDGSGWHLHYDSAGAGVAQRLGAITAMGLAEVVTRFGRQRLGACVGRTCRDVFVDASRNSSRRYCSDTCSNRSNVAAFRERHRSTG